MMEQKKCFYTGRQFEAKGDFSLSIDRIDNKLGYIEGNVVACTVEINRKKTDITLEEIEMIYKSFEPFCDPNEKYEAAEFRKKTPLMEQLSQSANNIEPQKQTPKDNLKFYNLPHIPNTNESLNKPIKENTIENFESSDVNENDDHNQYIIHVLGCPKCKEALAKQLITMDDKIRLEGYMELASYVIFGVFILLLIDTINKK
jgi:hypothetical protein